MADMCGSEKGVGWVRRIRQQESSPDSLLIFLYHSGGNTLRVGTKWAGDLMNSNVTTITMVPHDTGQVANPRLLNAKNLNVR